LGEVTFVASCEAIASGEATFRASCEAKSQPIVELNHLFPLAKLG